MKVAIVHDWLGSRVGGAEQVFFELAEHYPQAELFALVCDKRRYTPYLKKRNVHTSFLQRIPRPIKSRPELMLPFMRRAVESFDFTGYDLIITNSSAWVKNIKVPEGSKHFCYCHSPARMLWDSWPKYLEGKKLGPFKVGPVSRFVITHMASRLRLWDFYSTERIHKIVGNSAYIASRMKKYYGVETDVLYPPVRQLSTESTIGDMGDYYLVLSVLSRYKNIDIAIEAFKQTKYKLIIAGDGPDRARLENLAMGAPNITFEGRVSDARRSELMVQARGFIFPGLEDFGMTPVEAMSLGTPVLALAAGGLKETVQEGVSGLFFSQPTSESLRSALPAFEHTKWDKAKIKAIARKFSHANFIAKLDSYVEEALHDAK